MRINVRRAQASDTDWLTQELRHFAAFMDTKLPLFGDEAYVKKALSIMLESHLVLIAESETGKPMGFIGGMIIPHVFNPEIRLLSETFWWVAAEYRGSRAGLLLLNEFVAYGKEIADWVTVALEEKSPVDDRCLTRRGFRILEKNYLLEVC